MTQPPATDEEIGRVLRAAHVPDGVARWRKLAATGPAPRRQFVRAMDLAIVFAVMAALAVVVPVLIVVAGHHGATPSPTPRAVTPHRAVLLPTQTP